jgi:hypothetical protein
VGGNKRFGVRTASIFRVEVRDYGNVSTALLLIQRGSWYAILTHPNKGEVKVTTVLLLTKHHAMKAYWGVKI